MTDWPACTKWMGNAGINRLDDLAGQAEVQVTRSGNFLLCLGTVAAEKTHLCAVLQSFTSAQLSGVSHVSCSAQPACMHMLTLP